MQVIIKEVNQPLPTCSPIFCTALMTSGALSPNGMSEYAIFSLSGATKKLLFITNLGAGNPNG